MNTATLTATYPPVIVELDNKPIEKTHSVNIEKARTHKEVFNNLLDKLSVHHSVDTF